MKTKLGKVHVEEYQVVPGKAHYHVIDNAGHELAYVLNFDVAQRFVSAVNDKSDLREAIIGLLLTFASVENNGLAVIRQARKILEHTKD